MREHERERQRYYFFLEGSHILTIIIQTGALPAELQCQNSMGPKPTLSATLAATLFDVSLWMVHLAHDFLSHDGVQAKFFIGY